MLIDVEKSQLIIVDMQERLVHVVASADEAVGKCKTLLDAADLLGVAFTVTEQYPRGLGSTVPALCQRVGSSERLEKTSFSALRDDAVGRRCRSLQAAGKEQLIVTGLEAHICVLQTVLDAVAAGLHVFVVSDATASRHQPDKEQAERRMIQAGASIVTTEMVIFEWAQDAANPKFKALSKLVK